MSVTDQKLVTDSSFRLMKSLGEFDVVNGYRALLPCLLLIIMKIISLIDLAGATRTKINQIDSYRCSVGSGVPIAFGAGRSFGRNMF